MRKKPKIVLEKTNKNYVTEEILSSDSIYVVVYDGKPFNYKITNKLADGFVPKYKKTMFPNPGHANNLARKLNKSFKTNLFTVKKIDFK